ncbi:Hsp90 cochaperone [Pleodorina starrii]|nr:Hsp90 cochaperone [Pleodorina starrii]
MAEKGKTTTSISGSIDGEKKKIKGKIDPRIEQKIHELRRRAKEHLSTKQFEEALHCLDIAIELHSTSYKLYRMRSIALSCLQQYERAAADADRVVELAPHIMDGHYHKGFALFHLKDYAGAAHAFQQGLKLNPTDKTLRQGFWDAIALVSQSRTDGDAGQLEQLGVQMQLEVTPVVTASGGAGLGAGVGAAAAGGTPGADTRPGTGLGLGVGSAPGTAPVTESGIDPLALPA